MKLRFFDFEVFPHWWCCVFGDMPADGHCEPNIKEQFVVVQSSDNAARQRLMDMFYEPDTCLLGYNIKRYDLIIANAIYQGFTPEQVKIINDLLIRFDKCANASKEHIRLQPFVKKKIPNVTYQDLMDDSTGSLKEKEMNLGLNILESAVDFTDENLTNDKISDVLYYCRQDVYAAMKFYEWVVRPYTDTKLALGKKAGLPERISRMCTNAKLVSHALKASYVPFKDANCVDIELPKKIERYCRDNLPAHVLNKLLTDTRGFKVSLFGNEVSYGNGGLHSVLSKNIYVESDPDWALVNIDAQSYYPSIMLQFNCLSRCISNPSLFQDTFDERISLKHKTNKSARDEELVRADKLILNTTYGASGNKWLPLYDPYMCSKICRIGQIFLSSLANKIHNTIKECSIVQTNTDGILLYIKRSAMPLLLKLQQEWSDISGINMDTEFADKIWQRDVNNYLMVENNNGKQKIKRKGSWLNTDVIRLGYCTLAAMSGAVSAKAAMDFLLKGVSIDKTILNDTTISDFTIGCTKGPTFFKAVQKMNEGTAEEYEIDLYKANRIIATTATHYGKIYKLKMYKGDVSYHQMPDIPEHCLLMNKDLSDYTFDEIRDILDYNYYINKAKELLSIEWRQLMDKDLVRVHLFDVV